MESVRTIDKSHGDDFSAIIGELAEEVTLAKPGTLVSEIKTFFTEDEPINAIVVVDGRKPIGLVMNIHLDRTLSQRFGVALYYEKPIEVIMDVSPLIVESDTPVEKVADLAMNREKSKIFDHIVVTGNGDVSGIVSVQDILNKMINIQKRNTSEISRMNEQLHLEVKERRKAEKKLVRLNQGLEDRVAKRTAEIRESNKKLRKAAEAAEAANRSKSDFLANMSHELRTPLNHIIGFTELVLEQHFGDLNETQAEYLTDVLNSSNHLLSLINDILDLSKVEAGKLELDKSEIDLPNLLEKSLIMIKEKAQKHRIRLSTEFRDIPKTIVGDNRKLKQILYNLLSNSVKFTPEGGSICLSAQKLTGNHTSLFNSSLPRVNINDSDFLEISIQDSGIGLKQEDMERIFNPFEQAEEARNRRYQGTGLGLSLTKKFVELHNGWIWAESEGEGSGSNFRFIIPSRQQEHNNDEVRSILS